MNVKISLLCLSFCFAAAICMSISDSDDERWEDYKDPADYNTTQLEYGSEMYNLSAYYPSSFDWRDERMLSSVPNKGNCNRADWAFAAVGMLEGYLFREEKKNKNKNKDLIQLSVQVLIDCGKKCGNNACQNGAVNKALNYVTKYGISTEDVYPFNQTEGKCQETLEQKGILKDSLIKIREFKPTDENNIKYHIYEKSPITAKVSEEFLNYTGGIFNGGNCTGDNTRKYYNVLIVGYGKNTSTSQEYWIIKNWMGVNWGENGYARVARGASTKCKLIDDLKGIDSVVMKN